MAFAWELWGKSQKSVHDSGGRTVWLFDKNMEPLVSLSGFLEGTQFGDECNAPGKLQIDLPGTHPAVRTLMFADEDTNTPDLNRVLNESLWVVVETKHYRFAYRVVEVEINSDADGDVFTVHGEGLWELFNHLPLWASPGAPIVAQLKWSDVQAGDSLRVIKNYLFRNLAKDFQPQLLKNWDVWSASTWHDLRPEWWPLIVNPVHESENTEWTVLDSRFNIAGDMFKATLDAAGLQLVAELWLPGDPQPFRNHATLKNPTIVIDVKARNFASSTGGIGDVIRGVKEKIAGDNVSKAIVIDDTAFNGDNPKAWCVWDGDHMRGVSSKVVLRKATDSAVIVGGKSPQIVNSLIAAGSQALWQGIGAAIGALFPPFAALSAAGGAFLGTLQANALKDKLFAWSEFRAWSREDALGKYRYRGLVKPGEGFSLSTLQQAFTALQETQGKVSVAFEAGDGSPYLFGRDYRVGDQAVFRSRGVNFATFVQSVTIKPGRGGDDVDIGLGDPRLRESSARSLERSLKTLAAATDRIKTLIP